MTSPAPSTAEHHMLAPDHAPAARPATIRSALKRYLLPALRARGFKGTLPYLRRVTPQGTHLFTVRTSRRGGALRVELGRVPAGPYHTAAGAVIEPRALTTADLTLTERAWLHTMRSTGRGFWFRYRPSLGARVLAALARGIGRPADAVADGFERAACAVLDLLPECELWWAGGPELPHVRAHSLPKAGD